MSGDEIVMVKLQIKQNIKHMLYFTQSNVVEVNGRSKNAKKYMIKFNFLADQNKTLINQFLSFCPSIYEQCSQNRLVNASNSQFNKIFVYLIKLYYLYGKIVSKDVKITEQTIIAISQIAGKESPKTLLEIEERKQIKDLCKQVSFEIDKEFQTCRDMFHLSGKPQSNYDNICSVIALEKEKLKTYIMSLPEGVLRDSYIPAEIKQKPNLYIQNLLRNLSQARITFRQFRGLKYQEFVEKRYRSYFQARHGQLQSLGIREDKKKGLLVKRYTNNDREYLINMENLVRIRKKEIDYSSQNFEVCRALLGQLINHQLSTEAIYPMLNPKVVIFNQLSLKIHLSYQNPLLQSLGLLQRPANIQNTICFQATSKPYDTYAYYSQLTHPDLFYNYLLTVQPLLRDHSKNHPIHKYTLQKIRNQKEKSQSWRYMMNVHFIMSGNEYRSTKLGGKFSSKDAFIDFLINQERELLKAGNNQYILKLLSPQFCSFLLLQEKIKDYKAELSFFQDLLKPSQNSDASLQQLGHIKMHRYLHLFVAIVGLIFSWMERSAVFGNSHKGIRYLFIFYIGVFLQYNQLLIVCQYLRNSQERTINLLAQHKISRHPYVQFALRKLNGYDQKKAKKDNIKSFLIADFFCLYEKKDELFKETSVLMEEANQILQLSYNSKHVKSPQLNDEIRNRTNNMVKILGRQVELMRGNCMLLLDKGIVSHEIPKQQYSSSLSRKWFRILVLTLLALCQDNFQTVESLILPVLESQTEKIIQKNLTEQQYNKKNELFDYLLDLPALSQQLLGINHQIVRIHPRENEGAQSLLKL